MRGFHRVMHYSENFSVKYHEQNFCIKTAFSRQYLTRQTIDECEEFFLGGEFNKKISISLLNISTESAEKPAI